MRDYAKITKLLHFDLDPYIRSFPGFLTSDTDVKCAFAHSLASSFYKKLSPIGECKHADKAALEKFLDVNSRVTTSFEFIAQSEPEADFFSYFKDALNRSLEFNFGGTDNFDHQFIFDRLKVGPGAARKADATGFYTKLFKSDISTTDQYLVTLYRAAVGRSETWTLAEKARAQVFGFPSVLGCKIFFAPKTAEISRVCSTQASLNMLFQRACGDFIESRLRSRFGINLSDQPEINREMARLGSIDGVFSTIDLASASDCISASMLEKVLEPGMLKTFLFRTRSAVTELPNGELRELNMMSTMGNGFTFPLQTIIFASVVRAVYGVMGISERAHNTARGRNFSVFGDDIIVRREAYNFVVAMLEKLGFTVNLKKSFSIGPFRESCGEDYFLGHNIRGVYIKTLETPQSIYSAINRLVNWSAVSGIPLPTVLGYLRSLVRSNPVPRYVDHEEGIKLPLSHHRTVKYAYNTDYQSIEYQYRAYRRCKKKIAFDLAKLDQNENIYGLAISILGGYIRTPDQSYNGTDPSFFGKIHQFEPRQRASDRIRYKFVPQKTHTWDYPGFQDSYTFEEERDPHKWVSHSRWEAAVMASLG